MVPIAYMLQFKLDTLLINNIGKMQWPQMGKCFAYTLVNCNVNDCSTCSRQINEENQDGQTALHCIALSN